MPRRKRLVRYRENHAVETALYRGRCAKWVYPDLGDLPVNQITRE